MNKTNKPTNAAGGGGGGGGTTCDCCDGPVITIVDRPNQTTVNPPAITAAMKALSIVAAS